MSRERDRRNKATLVEIAQAALQSKLASLLPNFEPLPPELSSLAIEMFVQGYKRAERDVNRLGSGPG